MKSSGETRRIKKRKIQKDSDDLESETWHYKGEPVAQNSKLGGNPLHTEPVLQLTTKSQKDTEATWDHYLQISPNTYHFLKPSSPWSGKSMEDNLAI